MTDVLPRPAIMADDGLVVSDLFTDLVETTDRLIATVAAGDVLDSYLLAAAAVQIVEDDLQRDTLSLRRGAGYAAARRAPRGIPFALAEAATWCERLRSLSPGHRRTVLWSARAAELRDALACRVLGGVAPDRHTGEASRATGIAPEGTAVAGAWDGPRTEQTANWLLAGLARLPERTRRSVLRLPSCFRSFDQHPLDLVELAARYARRYPERDRPVVVLGVRTSGAYLAPLVAAALHDLGYPQVYAETARPEFRFRSRVRQIVRSVAARGGRALVVDDPPATGSAIRSVAAAAARHGGGDDVVTLGLPLFGDDIPASLVPFDSIILRYKDWSVHARLGLDSIRKMLADVLPCNEMSARPVVVRALAEAGSGDERGHRRTIVAVDWPDGRQRILVASGAGLGYFGRHALAVARALPGALPTTYGFTDGVVFRDWLPGEQRLTAVRPEDVPELVDYIAARAAALPAGSDRSADLAGRQPAWEAASRVLEPGYGRLGVLLRPMLIDPLVRRLCAVERPSVVDGATSARHWFRSGDGLRKTGADLRAFANTDLSCYDPVFDLAGIDPGSEDPELVAALRAAMPCDDERFLLYELVHLWDQARDGHAVHRAASRAVQRYVAATTLSGLRTDPDGGLCALDLDGVLEADSLGFPILTPTGATALRALIAHGYRPVPVTGRSLGEVRERCAAYGLAGGVAEYGAVAYDHRTAAVRELGLPIDAPLLAGLRTAIEQLPGVGIDRDYQRVVRAFRVDDAGARRRLATAEVRELMSRVDPAGDRLRVLRGDGQTDFVPTAVTKGTGLAALSELLGGPEIALAVGDAQPDLAMFGLAQRAFAPANADSAVRSAGIMVRRHGFATGLADGIGELIGHRPGGCPVCALPAPSARARMLGALLDAQRGGARGLPGAVLRGLRELSRGTA